MSKLAFISDIHGNLPALQAVLADIDRQGVERVYCLGDLVGYYSQINEVIDGIRERNIETIMGNHDYAMVRTGGVINRSRTCTNVLTKQLTYIRPDNLDFLRNLPERREIETDMGTILCVHGGINDAIDEYLPELTSEYFADLDERYKYVITGHNHIAKVQQFNDRMYGNTGAVGQPRDHDPRASYLIWNDGKLEFHRVEYDIEQTRKMMRDYGFEDYISDVLYKGCRIGEK